MTGALRVVARCQVADDVLAVTLADPHGDRLPPWTPGAHLDLLLPTGLVRQYSLCGDRWDGHHYRIAVLRVIDGRGGSAWIHDHLREGDVLPFGGPRNHFPMAPSTRYLFVAGGIGITPLLPMIDQAVRSERPWRLLYGGRRRTSMAFLDRLEALGGQVEVAAQDEVGVPDVAAWLGAPDPGATVYGCGPAGLLDATAAACAQWRPQALRTERFVAEVQDRAEDHPFTVVLRRSGTRLRIDPGTSVLDGLRDAGVAVLTSCRQGTCGTCEVAVLDGLPDHRDSVLDAVDREAGDSMMVCVSRARTDSLTLDL
ncbi:PDR/VanB family oxidoreductase [Pseudonocardia abyssalis]|uniref:Oxidoreductase n=1 Tax=Pseudonocardia abyssalis TaxID=2792008 RepID=A0ABS6URE2_9PSEU|nr:PDR/VanB family oxidoreductase [Pseudonocardia abyssalis]MBW0113757.1 oxidoreductase [Pseudonocardia abyssalis]MBW0134830.1 oxidoreductase [Pseudonocardia abyssalis]